MSKAKEYLAQFTMKLDGSWEWACYWCREPLIVFPDDLIAAVHTVDGEIGGIQCSQCQAKHQGEYAEEALRDYLHR